MKKRTLSQKIAQVAKWMPPTSHYKDRSSEWTPDQSQVLRFLIRNPRIASDLFYEARKSMVFDEESKLWVGETWKKKMEVKPDD